MHACKRGLFTGICVCFFSFMFCVSTALARPMGNFSVNHYGKIKIGRASVDIVYLIDIAEIPTYQEMRNFSIPPASDDPSVLRYIDTQDARLKEGIAVEIDGRPVELASISRRVEFAEGAGGLPTMKLSFLFRGQVNLLSATHKLSYVDNNFPGRAGWKEIVVVSDGAAILQSSATEVDRSKELTNYSTDLLNSPPQQISALVDFKTSFPVADERDSAIVSRGWHSPLQRFLRFLHGITRLHLRNST